MKTSTKKHTSAPSRELPESMAALAGGMVDVFNNILTTVMGACTLIDKDAPANDELLQYVALIRASAEHAADLTDRLLCASAMGQEEGHSCVHPQDAASADRSVRDKHAIHDIVPTTNRPDGASS